MFASLARVAMGAIAGLAVKLISRELFEGLAQTCIIRLLKWESARTQNTLDDALAEQVIAALKAGDG